MEQSAFPQAGVRAAKSSLALPPDGGAETFDGPDPALQVHVRWGDAVLHVAHLCPPRPFVVGRDADSDFRVCHENLGCARVVLPAAGGRYQHGNLGFEVVETSSVRREAVVARRLELRGHRWTLASLGLHMLFIGLLGFLPPGASALSLELLERDSLYTRYLITPAVLPPDELEWTPQPHGPVEGGSPGQAERGDEGSMGDKAAPRVKRRYQLQGPQDEQVLPRRAAEQEAHTGGLIGVLRAAAGVWNAPTSIYGRDNAAGADAATLLGGLLGHEPGSNFGFGGLGATGTGRHGGGDGFGTVGVGKFGTAGTWGEGGEGAGVGRGVGLRGRRTSHVPRIRTPRPDIAGSLSKETIRRVIHRQLAQVRHCYERQLVSRPDLSGRVAIRFLIDATGLVRVAVVQSSTLGHPPTEQCIAGVMRRLVFPAPEGGGLVKVTYPFILEQTGG